MITVSHDQLLRYTMTRQGLLDRLPLSEIAQVGALHATDQTTPYLSALARTDLARWEHFADRYYDHHAYTRLRCMRGTLHLIPEDHAEVVQCVYHLLPDEVFPEFTEYNISMEDATRLRFAIMEALEREGAQSSTSIKYYVKADLIKKHKNKSGGETTTVGPVMRWLWSLGLIESGIGVKDWRHKDHHFRIAQHAPAPCDRAQADQALARWYFALYAPAAYEDWAWWSGLSAERNKVAFAAIENELVEVSVKGLSEKLWMFYKDANILQSTDDQPPEMARLLPYEDALIKAYKVTRYRFYDEAGVAEDVAFSKYGEALPTLWHNGRIIGLWSWNHKAKEPMTVEPFHQMTRDLRKQIKPEVERTSAFVEASHVLWNS